MNLWLSCAQLVTSCCSVTKTGRSEAMTSPAVPLWSLEPKPLQPRPKASPARGTPDFWKTHEEYALQRSRESQVKGSPSLLEPPRMERPELAGRSALEVQPEPSTLLASYLPTVKVTEFSPQPPTAVEGADAFASPSQLSKKEASHIPADAYQLLLQQLAKKLAESGPPLDYLAGQSSAANQQLASAAWHQAAAAAALEKPGAADPWRPPREMETAFCLTEMVGFLQQRLEVQSKQIRHLKAELAARSRLSKSL
eukprot:symbB.v1.2.029599.t1/scaffold3262.1/size60070/3